MAISAFNVLQIIDEKSFNFKVPQNSGKKWLTFTQIHLAPNFFKPPKTYICEDIGPEEEALSTNNAIDKHGRNKRPQHADQNAPIRS